MVVLNFLFRWEVVLTMMGVLASIGVGVLAMNDFKIAKTLFLIAALWAMGGNIMWGINTSQNIVIRIFVVGISSVIIGILLFESWRYVDRKCTKKQSFSKITVSLYELSSVKKKGYLIYRIVFSNDSDKQCIIESAIMTTLTHDGLIKLSQYNRNDVNYSNNYKNMFDEHSQMSLVPRNKLNQTLPKTLEEHELWVYEIIESFEPNEFIKKYNLPNIKRIPVGVSIHFIDFKGRLLTDDFGLHAEILISDDGNSYTTSSAYIQQEIVMN